MADKNKVRFGLKNVHVGLLDFAENGDIEFGTPTKYPGAVSLSMDPEGEVTPFHADDIAYYTSTSNNGYSGDLEMAYLPDWFETDYLNSKVDTKGNIIEMADGDNKAFYMMFEFDGDVNATRHILYNVIAERPSIEASTREDTKEPQTTTLSYTASPLETEVGNIVKAKVHKEDPNYDTFFTVAPTLPTFTASVGGE